MLIKEIKLGGLTLSSNIFMAPLSRYTCYPFRMLCYELGAALCFTEMVSCDALKYQDIANQRLLLTTPDEKIPATQLWGSDPRLMEKMAESPYLMPFKIIDINMGCPVPTVVNYGGGSALLTDLKKAAAIIKGVKRSGKIITVKGRVGMREDNLVAAEFAKMAEDAGADMITLHGRSRSMMYEGTPYYDQIEQAKSAVSIPVIANGGINSVSDAEKMMTLTGADGIMIARYALENPFIFSELTGKKVSKSKYQLLIEQTELTSRYYDETFTLTYMKKIASHFMKKRAGVKHHQSALHACGNIPSFQAIISKIFEGNMPEKETAYAR